MIPNQMEIQQIQNYRQLLVEEEKAAATIEKYVRDVSHFFAWLPDSKEVDKNTLLAYKEHLIGQYKTASANSMLSALNDFFSFLGWDGCRLKLLRRQRKIFGDSRRELTKNDYIKLVKTAQETKQVQLALVLETICSTGIRVSELQYITCQALRQGAARVRCKGKERIVFLPESLRKKLEVYIKIKGIRQGSIFVTKNGRPLNRSNIWARMKRLCQAAHVRPEKVFPHNLRHLFACTYYGRVKDIVRLADILGHSSIETTRIYTVSCGADCKKQLSGLGLVLQAGESYYRRT